MERNLFTSAVTKKLKIAFLYYRALKGGRHADNFYDQKNYGAGMIIDVLFRNGYDVQITDKENAYKFDYVFISLTSGQDMICLARYLVNDAKWAKRKYKVVAGGFGMQNYIPISEYIDFAFWGRIETKIVELLECNFESDHRSLLKIGNHRNVWINQVDEVYRYVYHAGRGSTRENIYGCPKKCYFCHYTYVRKFINTGNNLYKFSQGYSRSVQVEKFNKVLYDDFSIGVVNTAIDGYSERLRRAFNIKLSNGMIREFVEYITDMTTCKGMRLKIYNIVGIETECEDDYREFVDNIKKIKQLRKYCTIILHSTPLNPSICTPVAYAAVDVWYDYKKYKVHTGVSGKNIIYKNNNLLVVHDYFNEDASGLIEHTVPVRTTFKNKNIFDVIAYDKKYERIKTDDKIKMLERIDGFEDIIRKYDVNEDLPTQYVNGYVSYDKIKQQRLRMLELL